jgi:hypothetical protein
MEEELREQGFTGNTEVGADYYKVFRKVKKDKDIRLKMRRFSQEYTIITYQELEIVRNSK